MRRTSLLLAAALVALFAFGLPVDAAPAPTAPDPAASEAVEADANLALVELAGAPLSTSARTRPAKGKKIDFNSDTVKSERARLSATRNDFKQWLQKNAPNARVTKEFDIALNAVGVELNGTSLATLRSAPNVSTVEQQLLYRPNAHDDPDLALVNAFEAWTEAGGEEHAGEGVKVAVIDTGIDASHPCFDDTGYPAQTQLGDTSLTNNKVIAAKVFFNKTKKDGVDASAVGSHGTHVAGTIACNAHTPATINGTDIPYDPSGVAPRALLGNYNVFPGTTGESRSEDILNAMEAAYADGFDVINMSLGGPHNGGGNVLNSRAVNNLDLANVVVAVSAGNDGPGDFTIGFPGAAERALTAGASTVGHNIVNQMVVDGTAYEFAVGDFAELTSDITAPLHVVPDPADPDLFPHGLSIACDGDPLPDLTGEIALIGRGTCDFTVKVRNVQNAGGVAAVVVDREAGPLFGMSHNELEPRPTIPGVLVSLADGLLIDDHDGESATLLATGVYTVTPADNNLMASFSSRGPVLNSLAVKPDLVAPGANIISSLPATSCSAPPCWGFNSGTSMASPHLAGAAAVVRGLHPDWSAAQVRSAIVNTAQEGLLRDSETDTVTDDVTIVGAGLLDVFAATTAVAGFDPVSTAFGAFSSTGAKPRSSTVTITNLSDASQSFTAAIADDASDGMLFAGGGAFTLAPGASQTITVTATPSKGLADGPRQAFLRLSAGGVEVAHAAVFAYVGEGVRAPGPHNIKEVK